LDIIYHRWLKQDFPDGIVYQARDEILDFMTAEDTKLVPGFLGDSKIEVTLCY
jgi:hypothetical protein